jgi:hypothetical protein
MATMEGNERLEYAEQMVLMLSKYKYYRSYEGEITSFIDSSLSESRNLSTSRFDRRFKSEESSNDSMGSSVTSFRSSRVSSDHDPRTPISPVTVSSKSSSVGLRQNESENSRNFYSPDRDSSTTDSPYIRESISK